LNPTLEISWNTPRPTIIYKYTQQQYICGTIIIFKNSCDMEQLKLKMETYMATIHFWKNKSYDIERLISKSSNFDKFPGRLSDLLFGSTMGNLLDILI